MGGRTLGAAIRDDGVAFGVWAPAASSVEVEISRSAEPRHEPLVGRDGFFSGFVPDLRAGASYRFRLDGKERYPDPRSRYQPEGSHGPREVIDLGAFQWTDGWPGISADGLVVYELHVGAYGP